MSYPPVPMEQSPPQSVETEQAVLGAMMIDSRAVDIAREMIETDDFYHAAHRHIYTAILTLSDTNRPADLLSLKNELRRVDKLDEVGGTVYVARLSQEVATWANIRPHCAIVSDKARSRRIIAMTADLTRRAYTDTEEPDALIQSLEAELMSLQGIKDERGLVHYEEVLTATLAAIERMSELKGELGGIPSGFSELDAKTGGFQKGDLILLAGRPKMGKTALAMTFMAEAATAGKSCAYFSMEMSAGSLGIRHLAMEASIDALRIRMGNLKEAEWVALAEAAVRLSKLNIHIDDRPGLNVLEIGSACRKVKRSHGLDLIVVDYLQLMSSHVRTATREQEVSKMSVGLKTLAREMDCPVIALSQLSRKCEERPNKRPLPSDLRDSGSLEQDCDGCIFVYRSEVYGKGTMDIVTEAGKHEVSSKGMAEIILSLQRSGPTGTIYARWMPEFTRFDPYVLDSHHEAPAELFVEHYDND